MAVDLRRLAVEQGHEAQVHVEKHCQQPGDPERDQSQGLVDRRVHHSRCLFSQCGKQGSMDLVILVVLCG